MKKKKNCKIFIKKSGKLYSYDIFGFDVRYNGSVLVQLKDGELRRYPNFRDIELYLDKVLMNLEMRWVDASYRKV